MVEIEKVLSEAGIKPEDVVKIVPIARKLWERHANKNTDDFKRESEELFRDWTVELALRDAEAMCQLTAMAEVGRVTLEHIRELVDDPEFMRVRVNYGYEAAREALHERRKMLAFAAAGTLASGLSIAESARIERTIRQLDPEDVLLLADIFRIVGDAAPMSDAASLAGRQAHLVWAASAVSGEAILGAACVRQHAPQIFDTDQELFVTRLGQLVLKTLQRYVDDAAEGKSGPAGSRSDTAKEP